MPETLFDPHVVKVVTDAQGYALYFSRAPIPWHRDEFQGGRQTLPPGGRFLRHIGLYAYRAAFLARFVAWPPAPLELAESLEQLRVLWHGEGIHVGLATEEPGPGVDTAADVQRLLDFLRRGRAALGGSPDLAEPRSHENQKLPALYRLLRWLGQDDDSGCPRLPRAPLSPQHPPGL